MDAITKIKKQFIAVFDEENLTLHMTADEPMIINSERKLFWLYHQINQSFKKYSVDDRIYVLFNLNVFVIDPNLAKLISPYLQRLHDKYVFKNGMVGYGKSISRVTFKIIVGKLSHLYEHFFETKEAALEHLNEHILNNTDGIRSKIFAEQAKKKASAKVTPTPVTSNK